MTLEELFKLRRDTRHFTNEEVPDEVLNNALHAGHAAPSVGLTDATRYYIIRSIEIKEQVKCLFDEYDQRAVEKISDDSKKAQYQSLKLEAITEAPLGLVVCYDRSVLNDFTIGTIASNDTIKFSAVCSVQNIWLSLTAQGYSMGWVSILNYTKFKSLLGLPEHIEPLGYFCVGKPATDYDRQPMLQQLGWKDKSESPEVTEIKSVKYVIPYEVRKDINSGLTNPDLHDKLKQKIDLKTKPLGSLGVLEKLALRIGLAFNSSSPQLTNPHIVVFAADHGIAQHGVSAYPQEVTRQMVENFLSGGAAVNVFCRQNGLGLLIADAGVNYDFPSNTSLINNKAGKGTRSFLQEAAMSLGELDFCLAKGAELVRKLKADGCSLVGFGEMGIGNTSSASVLMSLICDIPLEDCVGRGTGLSDEQLNRKCDILKTSVINAGAGMDLKQQMAYFGGFEIMQICGAILEASHLGMLVMVDGFICSAAYLCAFKLDAGVEKYAIFSHQSDEYGHKALLKYLRAEPLLQLGLRLGEGTGAALAYPIVKNAVAFLNDMASFESAGVSNKENEN